MLQVAQSTGRTHEFRPAARGEGAGPLLRSSSASCLLDARPTNVRLNAMSRSSAPEPAQKICASCGRRIEWRKRWERDWEQVKFCSTPCRRRGVSEVDSQLEESILSLLAARTAKATICPSEAARAVASAATSGDIAPDAESWRELMEPARRAARRLVAVGKVQITQGGAVVDPSTARGPIRVRAVR